MKQNRCHYIKSFIKLVLRCLSAQQSGGGNLTAPAHSLEGLFKSFVPYQSARSGFTLAEVLITLGIIGVVAAMTMPVLISNYRESVIKNQFKKSLFTSCTISGSN